MPDLSPIYGFESPTNSETPDLGYWIKRLKDKVEEVLSAKFSDGGWKDVTVAGGFAPMGGAEKPQARYRHGVVYVRGGFLSTGLTANGTHTVGTLPAGIPTPPVNDIRALGSSSGAATSASGFVQTGGELTIRVGATVGGYYKFDRSYLPD